MSVNGFIKSCSKINDELQEEQSNLENFFCSKFEERLVKENKSDYEGNNQLKSDKEFINYLIGDPVSIIFQNTISYMGGVKNIWTNSKNRNGLEITNGSNNNSSELFSLEQNYSDGKLECFTYENGCLHAIERLFKGLARKLFQDSGPFLLKFKEITNVNLFYN